MPPATNSIETRQRTEDLFVPPTTAEGNQIFLPVGACVAIPAQPTSPPGPAALGREIDGFDVVSFFGLSDQPFSVAIYEAAFCDGPYVLSQTLNSAMVGGLNRLATRIASSAKFMRIVVCNTGAGDQTMFSFVAFGIPIATAGA